MVGAGSTEENKLKQYAVYWRNPVTAKGTAAAGIAAAMKAKEVWR